MLKLENSIRGLSFSRVAFDLTIQGINKTISLLVLNRDEYIMKVIGRLFRNKSLEAM